MNYILFVEELYDEVRDIAYGCVGVELVTGKLRFFSYFDKKHRYNPYVLTEFNPKHIKDPFLKDCYIGNYSFETFPKNLDPSWESKVDEAINHHLLFNKSHGLPYDELLRNKKWLCITAQGGYVGGGEYIAEQNIIDINAKEYPDDFSRNEKFLSYYHTLIHEIGHMKATSFEVTKNKVIIKTGFNVQKWSYTPIFLPGNEVFVKLEKLQKKPSHDMQVLEELINEEELRCVDENYILGYPKYGQIFNELCDNTLIKRRYVGDIDYFYERMFRIIPNVDLATELLETIYADGLMYEGETEKIEKDAQKIVQEYVRARRKKNKIA